MAHVGRLRRGSLSSTDPFSPDEDAISSQQWLHSIGAVNSCGAAMEMLLNKYGGFVFGVCVDVFYENIPTTIRLQIERARRHNTRMKEMGNKSILKHFGGLDGQAERKRYDPA